MNLAEVIFEKAKDLPAARALEVIDFIDFLKTRIQQADETGTAEEQAAHQAALAELAKVRIHWGGKPIPNRDDIYDDARN